MPNCHDIQFMFARGSGQPYMTGGDWFKFVEASKWLAKNLDATYIITDLEYPAVTVKDPVIAVGAYISSGEYFEFGQSVLKGQRTLRDYYLKRVAVCPDEVWVLGGYSQGAIVETGVLKYFNPDTLAYIGLFGDPELSLPEGKGGWRSDACHGKNWSPYRVNVPNCKTYKGSLGQRSPYEYGPFLGKYGLWCNDRDFICGSSKTILNTGGHTEYKENGSYLWMMLIAEPRVKEILDRKKGVSNIKTSSIKLADYYSGTFPFICGDKYYATVNEPVTIVGNCGATNLSGLRFSWSVDGGPYVDGSSSKEYSFDAEGEHVVKLRVWRNEYNYQDSLVSVLVGDGFDEDEMSAPTDVLVINNGDSLRISWDDSPAEAKYLLVSRNGFNLGLAPVEDGYVDITDIGEVGEDILGLTWADDSFTIGEWAEYRMSDGELVGDASESISASENAVSAEIVIENADTSDSFKKIIIAIVVLFGIILVAVIRSKNAHRER